ncbi:Tl [Trypoxylus dichotomus]
MTFIAIRKIRAASEVEIEVDLGERVKIVCNRKGVPLPDVEVDVGYVKVFQSRKCNLANKLGEILTVWNVTGIELFDIQNFTDEQFILEKNQFDGVDVSEVKKLEIFNSNITKIAENTFQDFIKLEKISLRLNEIGEFPNVTYLKNIHSIDLSSNQINNLPERLNLPSLTLLSLWNNNLTTLNESCFTGMSALITLELRRNQFTHLPTKILHPLTGLEELSLSDLVEIPNGFFAMNRALTKLIFYSINLTSIPEDVFLNLSNLTTLMLTDTSLETLPENIFVNQVNLKKLRLYNNRFKTLPKGIFRNLHSLESLQIFGNQLEEWKSPPNVLPKLNELNLSLNKLTIIEADFSNPAPALKVLNLSRNKISYINASAFSSFELRDLDLSHNNLSEVNGDVTFIAQMKRTTSVNLAFNAYESLPGDIVLKTSKLNMAYNKIKTLEVVSIMNFDEAYFQNNSIKSIFFTDVPNLFVGLPKEYDRSSRIYMDNNSIDCNCDAFELVQYFDGSYKYKDIYPRLTLNGDVQCQSPATLAGRYVRSLKSQSFTCDYQDAYVCPEKCSCEVHPYYRTFNITCSNRNLSISPTLPQINTEQYVTEFGRLALVANLSNNFIKNFTKRDSSYINVSQLYLSNNELNLVNWLPQHLEILQLDDNKLENLDNNAIMTLNNSRTLKSLTLHNNLWSCNCTLLNFTKLVKAQHLKIPFESRILCADKRKIVDLVEGNICGFENQTALIVIGVCFFMFLSLIAIILVLYYKYEYHIKVWLYSKPVLMRFVTEDDLDKDKMYDAFVSFSHKNEEFVDKQLVRILENGPNPYKLCIHSRDWIVGEFIHTQIITSVQNSRRTIIVLSPDFLESEWATVEFRTAHTEAMREGRNRVIVILYGDIDPKSIADEELRIYLSTNTYVKWGDPWFWKKLKYVLPHKSDGRNNSGKCNSGKRLRNQKMENIMVTLDKMDLINSPATPNVGTPPAISLDPLLIKSNSLPRNGKLDIETPPADAELVAASS